MVKSPNRPHFGTIHDAYMMAELTEVNLVSHPGSQPARVKHGGRVECETDGRLLLNALLVLQNGSLSRWKYVLHAKLTNKLTKTNLTKFSS